MRVEMMDGAKLFNAGEYWEAHEVWEIPWNAAKARVDLIEASYVQALILFAAAIYKRRYYNNARGGQLNYGKALRKLEPVPAGYSLKDGIDLEQLKLEVLAALENAELFPQLPL